MDVDTVWQTIDSERLGLADLFDDLAPHEWETPSLCAGWRVRDVAAHLTLAHMSAPAAAVGLLRARGGFHRMIHDTAVRQAALPVDEYARLLRAMVGSRRRAPGVTPLEPLVDVLVHGQDIAVPLGRDRAVPPAAAATAADRVWASNWAFGTRRRLAGLRLTATDADWSVGSGPAVTGPVRSMLLLVTGRPVPAGSLSGPGAARLPAQRVGPGYGWRAARRV